MPSSIDKELAELRESLSTSGMSRSQIASVLADARATLLARQGGGATGDGDAAASGANATAPRAGGKRGATAPLARDGAAKRARPASGSSASESESEDDEPAPRRRAARGRGASAQRRGSTRGKPAARVVSSEEEEEDASSDDEEADESDSEDTASTQDVGAKPAAARGRAPPKARGTAAAAAPVPAPAAPSHSAPPPVLVKQPSLQSVLARAREALKPPVSDPPANGRRKDAVVSDASDFDDEDDDDRGRRGTAGESSVIPTSSSRVTSSSVSTTAVAGRQVPAALAMPAPLRMPVPLHFSPAPAPASSPVPPPSSQLPVALHAAALPLVAAPVDVSWSTLSRECTARLNALCDAMRVRTGMDPAALLRSAATPVAAAVGNGAAADSPSSGTPASAGTPAAAASAAAAAVASAVMTRAFQCRTSAHVAGDDERIADMVRAWERTPVGSAVQQAASARVGRPPHKSLMWWGVRDVEPLPTQSMPSASPSSQHSYTSAATREQQRDARDQLPPPPRLSESSRGREPARDWRPPYREDDRRTFRDTEWRR